MDMKTKSILIGLASSFVAVMVIVLLFFSLADLDGSKGRITDSGKNAVNSDQTVSDGKTVSDDEGDKENEKGDKEKDDVSSEEVSSEDTTSSEEEEQETGAFGRKDIEGITKGFGTFAKVVSAVSPVSYEWNAQSMGATSEVEVKLIASDGSYAVIGVPYESSDYTVDGETDGIGIDVTDWDVYDQTRKKQCRVKEIVWLSNNMKFKQPRGVKIGTAYGDITAAYLKIENPSKSYLLYQGTDVITDENKLNAYKKDSSAYIGGKVYKTTTLLDSLYKEDPDAYPFARTSKNVIRYGFNSIVDTDDTSGQWYIEYATQNSKVMGIYFHMTGADD